MEAEREHRDGEYERKGKAAIILCQWTEQRPGGGEQNWREEEKRMGEVEKASKGGYFDTDRAVSA